MLSVLSAMMGLKFQDHAVYFLPVVFRVLPITVQVRHISGCIKG